MREVDGQVARPAGLNRSRHDLGDLVVKGAAQFKSEQLAAQPGCVPLQDPVHAINGMTKPPIGDRIKSRSLVVAMWQVLQQCCRHGSLFSAR